jgi:hypothetical protein
MRRVCIGHYVQVEKHVLMLGTIVRPCPPRRSPRRSASGSVPRPRAPGGSGTSCRRNLEGAGGPAAGGAAPAHLPLMWTKT